MRLCSAPGPITRVEFRLLWRSIRAPTGNSVVSWIPLVGTAFGIPTLSDLRRRVTGAFSNAAPLIEKPERPEHEEEISDGLTEGIVVDDDFEDDFRFWLPEGGIVIGHLRSGFRFIPAPAGNRIKTRQIAIANTVHPRAFKQYPTTETNKPGVSVHPPAVGEQIKAELSSGGPFQRGDRGGQRPLRTV